VRGEARGATVGQFAEKPTRLATVGRPGRGLALSGRSDARAKLGKPCRRRAVRAVERAARRRAGRPARGPRLGGENSAVVHPPCRRCGDGDWGLPRVRVPAAFDRRGAKPQAV